MVTTRRKDRGLAASRNAQGATVSSGAFAEPLAGEPQLSGLGASVYSDLDPADRVEVLKADLLSAVSDMVNSGQIEKWLDRVASNRLGRWSFNNQVLAWMQTTQRRQMCSAEELAELPEDPVVMTAVQWKERHGRTIRRGERALWILAPRTVWVEEDDPDVPGQTTRRKIVAGFRGQAEFDLCQTEGGEPWPADAPFLSEVDSDLHPKAFDHVQGKLSALGWTVALRELSDGPLRLSGKLGFASPATREVVIDSRLSAAQRFSTLAHEAGHVVSGHTDDLDGYRAHRGSMETEAEMTAYLLTRTAGGSADECSSFSPAYIASWSKGDPAVIEKAFSRAVKSYHTLWDGFDSNNEKE